jgi:hypothetical protein
MSPAEAIRIAAHEAVITAGAIMPCPRHPNSMLRTKSEHAEHYAYALATTALKREGAMNWRQDILDAIKAELEVAASGPCPECARDQIRQ